MTVASRSDTRERTGEGDLPGWVALWFGALGGQAAWALAVLAAYPTVAIVCEAGASTLWIHLVRWVAAVVAVAATAVALRSWRAGQAATGGVPPKVVTRVRFMGLGGALLSGAAVFLLFVEDIAAWVIHPCL